MVATRLADPVGWRPGLPHHVLLARATAALATQVTGTVWRARVTGVHTGTRDGIGVRVDLILVNCPHSLKIA